MTDTKIETTDLTQEQWAAVDAALVKWVDIGRSTQRCDRVAAEAALKGLYEEILEQPCPTFEWHDSPKAAVFGRTSSDAEAIRNSLLSMHCYVWAIHRLEVSRILDISYDVNPEVLRAFLSALTDVGSFSPQENLCICIDRPTQLAFDAEDNLHAEHGPAVAYADGWKLYYWHGTSVPAEWIENKELLDPSLALTHENVEMRRIVAEIVGWDRVLSNLPTRVIDENPNPAIGTLFECDLPDAPQERFLRVLCATGRTFMLPVPKTMRTALAANADSYQMTEEEFLQVGLRT